MRTRETEQLKNADLHMLLMRHGVPIQPLAAKAGIASTALHEALMGSRLIGPDACDRLQAVIESDYPQAFGDFMAWRGVRDVVCINPEIHGDLSSPLDDAAVASRLATDILEASQDGTLTFAELERIQSDFSELVSIVAPQLEAWKLVAK